MSSEYKKIFVASSHQDDHVSWVNLEKVEFLFSIIVVEHILLLSKIFVEYKMSGLPDFIEQGINDKANMMKAFKNKLRKVK